MNRIHIRAQVRELVATDVATLIGPRLYGSITAVDPSPFFVELIVAHEGTSHGEIAGFGARAKEWGKRVVRALARAFSPFGRWPAQIFDGSVNWHGNESGRVPVGEVVHSRITELAGVEANQTIGYIFANQPSVRDAIRNGQLDCCSIEADVIASGEGGRIVIDDVERASAVVLGHTSRQTPGFALATVRALSEFCPPDDPPPPTPPAPPAPPAPVSAPAAQPPAAPPVPTPPAAPQLTREQLIEQAKALGVTAADFAPVAPPTPAQPAPAIIPAPPERKDQPATSADDWNEFLPADL